MGFIDLHIHTTASDGSVTPEEIVSMALQKGLYAIAITDHDTVDGIPRAINAAEDFPIYVIPGVELSCSYYGLELHLLGLNIDYSNPTLLSVLDELSKLRYKRNEQICSLLRDQGVNISMNLLLKRFNNKTITRNNIAVYLIENGYVNDKKAAFDRYIGSKASCYVPRYKIEIKKAVELIHMVHGTCSLAHPVQYKLSEEDYRQLFIYLKNIGIECIEGYHPDNSVNDEKFFINLAKEFGFGLTGGSDYHGKGKPDIEIGTGRGSLMVPTALLNNIIKPRSDYAE